MKKTGFIRMTLIVIGALVILKYAYDVDVVGFLTEGRFKEWLDKLYSLSAKGWERYSEFLTKIWSYAINFVKNLIAKN